MQLRGDRRSRPRPNESDVLMKVYIDPKDWWVGYYCGDTHHYVCPLPTVVIRWKRREVSDDY